MKRRKALSPSSSFPHQKEPRTGQSTILFTSRGVCSILATQGLLGATAVGIAWDSCSFLSETQSHWGTHLHLVTQAFIHAFVGRRVMEPVTENAAWSSSRGIYWDLVGNTESHSPFQACLIRICILIRSLDDRHAH